MVQGRFDVLTFTSDGVVKNRIVLGSKGSSVVEIPGATGTVLSFMRPRRSYWR